MKTSASVVLTKLFLTLQLASVMLLVRMMTTKKIYVNVEDATVDDDDVYDDDDEDEDEDGDDDDDDSGGDDGDDHGDDGR